MTGDRSWLQDLHRISPITITVANGGSLTANEAGTAVFLNHRGTPIQLSHVLLVPGLRFNLLSTTGIMTAGVRVSMADGHSDILYHGESVLRARLHNNSWVLDVCRPPCPPSGQLISLPAVIDPTSPPAFVRVSVVSAPIDIWHRRLSHLSLPSLRRLLSDLSVGGRLVAGPSSPVCQGCVQGKITHPPFPSSDTCAGSLLALVHTDLCDMGVQSEGQARYMLVLVDDWSRYTWAYFIRHKSDVLSCFMRWLPLVERSYQCQLRTLRSDNGGEFVNVAFSEYLAMRGIRHETTVPYSSQQNGVAERANRTIVERTVAILSETRLPSSLWAEVMQTVVYLKNRSPSRSVPSTPYQILHARPPNLAHLRVIGCAAWVLLPKHKRPHKLAPRAYLCCMLGYSLEQKAYRLWDPAARQLVISRDVVFDETQFPFASAHPPDISSFQRLLSEIPLRNVSAVWDDDDGDGSDGGGGNDGGDGGDGGDGSDGGDGGNPGRDDYNNEDNDLDSPKCSSSSGILDGGDGAGDINTPAGPRGESVLSSDSGNDAPPSSETSGVPPDHRFWYYIPADAPPVERSPLPPPDSSLPRTRSGQSVKPPERLSLFTSSDPLTTCPSYESDLDTYLGHPGNPSYHPSDIRLPAGALGMPIHAFVTQALDNVSQEPRSWRSAMASPQASDWRAAADDEMASLIKAQVFHYVPRSSLPPQSKVVSCKWVFKVKRHADGSIEQYKARLCACGFDQVAGVDYEETFAPVAKFQSIRVILALAAHHDLELHQMDVKTAFLYGKLEEDVYLDQPEGYDTKPGMVWKLDKALYGLKQAPRAWYQELHSTLMSLGFTRTYSDYSVYVRGQGSSYIVVGVYVDDLTIAA